MLYMSIEHFMETSDRALLERWMSVWGDLTDFEVHPVMTSTEAADKVALLL